MLHLFILLVLWGFVISVALFLFQMFATVFMGAVIGVFMGVGWLGKQILKTLKGDW